jgi:hypothetical protein
MERGTELLIDILRRALGGPPEQRLFRSGKLDGLFPSRAGASALAAAEALRLGLLEITHTEIKGKSEIEWVRITPRGVEHLHEQESPLAALRELLSALRAGRGTVPLWLAEMRDNLGALENKIETDVQKWEQRLSALEKRVDETLRRLEAAGPLLPAEVAQEFPWAVDALNYLDRRRQGGATTTCPLPELFAAVVAHYPGLSVPAFHDGLRKMHSRRAVRLLPAGDEAVDRPEYALLIEATLLYFVER